MASSRPWVMKTQQNFLKSVFLFSKCLSTLPSESSTIARDLISIFTKQPFSRDNPKLKTLAPMLTANLVETVLNGFKRWKLAYDFFSWASNQCTYKHNIYTYNAMASILSRARQNAPLRALAKDVVDSRCSMSPGALGYLIRCMGSVGLVDEANVLFDQVKTMGLCVPNNYSYNCLLETLSSSCCIDLVDMRLKEMRNHGWGFDRYTLMPVLRVYCKIGKFDKAMSVFSMIDEHGWVDAHVYSMLIVSLSRWGDVDKACECIEAMEARDIKLNEKTFCALIHGFVKQSRVDKALELFRKMQISGFAPDIALYDVLIGGLCMNKELEKALLLHSEMKELKIQPDVGILHKLVSSLSKEERFSSLVELFHDDMDDKTLTSLSNSVLSSFVSHGSINKAYSLLSTMMGDEYGDDAEKDELFRDKKMVLPNTTSFTIVIDGALKAGKLDLALVIFRDMARFGSKRPFSLYRNLIEGMCSSDRLEESYELLREMQESGFEPTQFIHNTIFGCLCKRTDVSGALDMVRTMRIHGHEPWIKHSTLLAKELCKQGKTLEACQFLADMVQEGFHPDIIAYSAALGGLLKDHEVDKAFKFFQDICAGGYCPDVVAYNILIKGLCKASRITDAQNLFKEMEMKGLVPSVVTYNLLIDGLCKNDGLDEAMLFLSKMVEEERDPNVITYTTLINGCCNAGRPDDALVMWNEMKEKGCAPNKVSFMALIDGLCKCSKPDAALVHFREMKAADMVPDTFVYTSMISSFLVELNMPLAFEILKEMADDGKLPNPLDNNFTVVRDAIHKLAEDSRTSNSVKDLIDGLCKNDGLDEAMLFPSRMVGEERDPNVVTYTTLINECCNAGRPDDALVLWNEMKEKGCAPDRVSFMALIDGLCKCSRPDAALVHFREMKAADMEPDTFVYTSMISSFLVELNTPLAFEILKEMADDGKFPDPLDNNFTIVRDAIHKLVKDSRTSNSVKDLIAKGSIPTASVRILQLELHGATA